MSISWRHEIFTLSLKVGLIMMIFIFHGKCFKNIEKMKSRFFLESGPIPLIYGCSDLVPGITDPDLADFPAIFGLLTIHDHRKVDLRSQLILIMILFLLLFSLFGV